MKYIGLKVPEIYLPKAGTDMKKRAVVACDQYTSQPEYRQEVQKIIGDAPSTYNIIFPEVYLEKDDKSERIKNIQKHMNQYLQDGILENQWPCFILVDRKTSHTASRKGLVVALDLECYDYSIGSQTLIRATEWTIVDRLPPRIEIRKDAPLELPHIMVLIDDPKKTVIEPLFTTLEKYTKVYNTDLMMNGWHITGYKIDDEASITNIVNSIQKIAETSSLLFAMGDGNHSLATAKAIREEKKKSLSIEDQKDNPARFALVELVNIHDDGLVFEPIHRILFNIQADQLIKEMIVYFQTMWSEINIQIYSTFEEMKNKIQASTQQIQYFSMMYSWAYCVVELKNPKLNLEVGNLQSFLDSYLNTHTETKIDYVHWTEVTAQLGTKEGNIGFILPIMDKKEFFPTIIKDWALPRKTFSMGEAEEKRYYLECRKIK